MLNYDKNYMGTSCQENWSRRCEIVGEQIQADQIAQKLHILRFKNVPLSLISIEKGATRWKDLRVLYALQPGDDILLLAKEDAMGKALQDLGLKKRERASKRNKN